MHLPWPTQRGTDDVTNGGLMTSHIRKSRKKIFFLKSRKIENSSKIEKKMKKIFGWPDTPKMHPNPRMVRFGSKSPRMIFKVSTLQKKHSFPKKHPTTHPAPKIRKCSDSVQNRHGWSSRWLLCKHNSSSITRRSPQSPSSRVPPPEAPKVTSHESSSILVTDVSITGVPR